jgi:hypothetical protein
VAELEQAGLSRDHLHAVARPGIPLEGLPQASPAIRRDELGRLDKGIWHTNLTLFWIALGVLAIAGAAGNLAWVTAMAVLMAASFLFGLALTRLPHTHLSDLKEALARGEIVLMADLPKERLAELEGLIHHRHPESAVGGVSWSHPAWGL